MDDGIQPDHIEMNININNNNNNNNNNKIMLIRSFRRRFDVDRAEWRLIQRRKLIEKYR